MMNTIKVCVGSSCFRRGAQEVIDILQGLIDQYGGGRIELKGMFCQEKCHLGVTVAINDKVFTGVSPQTIEQILRDCLGDAVGSLDEGEKSGSDRNR
jgi:NADH:ubiquinone oxidoreductase subunit E